MDQPISAHHHSMNISTMESVNMAPPPVSSISYSSIRRSPFVERHITMTSSNCNKTSCCTPKDKDAGSLRTSSTCASASSPVVSIVSNESRGVSFGRFTFLGFLVAVAGLLGWLGFFLLANAEQNLVNEQYYVMTARALETVRSVAVRRGRVGPLEHA